ncbi:MAG: glycosyltransferase family 4 protein [Vogesella sp.]|uniref:glycosyltransferase family 4 protein n=1 Tax=Vogesella sp. TaxID=1904252 RepID=UPI00391C15A4
MKLFWVTAMAKYLLVQTAIGDYRQAVLDLLYDLAGDDLLVVCGDVYFDKTTLTRVSFKGKRLLAFNKFFLGRRFLWQIGTFQESLKADSVIIEMNPRIINSWFVPIFRKLLGKKTVMWGHAWPREGKLAQSDYIRNLLRLLADIIVVYTETQKSELQEKMPGKKILSAPNALYRSDEMSVAIGEKRNFVYVGRLVSEKKPMLMIKAFFEYLGRNPEYDGTLVVVGDGPERVACESLVDSSQYRERVVFKGHVADVAQLRSIYSSAFFSLSPGYVGLSITQSFSFGVPMIVAHGENHSPEIEAAVENSNAIFFKMDSVEDLAAVMSEAWRNREFWLAQSDDIVDNCKKRYSADYMAHQLWSAMNV